MKFLLFPCECFLQVFETGTFTLGGRRSGLTSYSKDHVSFHPAKTTTRKAATSATVEDNKKDLLMMMTVMMTKKKISRTVTAGRGDSQKMDSDAESSAPFSHQGKRLLGRSPSLIVTCVLGFYLVFLGSAGVHAGPVPTSGRGRGGRGSNPANAGGGHVMDILPIVAIGRCRVQCMKQIPKFLVDPTEQHQFMECWEMCKHHRRNPDLFRPLCTGKGCAEGCTVACEFWNNIKRYTKVPHNNVTWTFSKVDARTDYEKIRMNWTRPSSDPNVTRSHPIVYTLLMRERNDDWRLIHQTPLESYNMDYDEAHFVPEFLIQAVDDTGIVAESVFHVADMLFSGVLKVDPYGALTDVGDGKGGQGRNGQAERGRPTIKKNSVNLNYTFTNDRDDNDVGGGSSLKMRLEWSHAQQTPEESEGGGGGGGEGEGRSRDDDVVYYDVLITLLQCGVYEDLPPCAHPMQVDAVAVPVRRGDKPQFTISELFFNTRYKLNVLLLSSEPQSNLAEVTLVTPFCQYPSDDFRDCLYQPVVTATANVTDDYVDGGTDPPLLTELIRNVNIKLLPPPQPYDDDVDNYVDKEGTVRVNVSWTYMSDVSKVNFAITLISNDDDGITTDKVEVSGVTYFVTTLLDNTVYQLMIELVAPPETVGALGEHGASYIDDSRQFRQFNTSELQLAAQERPQAVIMNDRNQKAVNGVIIGMTCLGILVVVAFAFAFLYKKRQSFKSIIIPKATVSKSNSYKSSVGGKADYSNQLMVFCDEWELDPQQLKFSTPLGQGAFGKVVTGYYSDHRVAIKLVKEGAPLSYKEDLVAEINLMKRLGTHPNIVCLVGACTVTEPIALVMEYVPYGNLQNFLKKCRLEGDLQKRANGPSEIQYSMLQDCGGIENGVITPTDMLSFARQVAMAMEYLAEKKYVHRDLAARNILLHFNKVVKVCDFGLSRDIFNDNQYKKLTNGKLPLKWMAIESLRDRVFTTQSDVWSFGILLWEIVTMGASPYPCIALADLYYVLSNHYRMDKPSNCSNELYAMMRACWAETPLDRPSFTELREQLEDLMAEDRDYLVLEDIDVPLSASESSSNPAIPELFSGDMLPSQSARDVVVSSSSSGSGAIAQPAASASASVTAGAAAAKACGAGGGLLLRQGGPLPPPPPPPPLLPHPPSAAVRRPPMTIDVCIHQKSTERLVRPSESDSSP